MRKEWHKPEITMLDTKATAADFDWDKGFDGSWFWFLPLGEGGS